MSKIGFHISAGNHRGLSEALKKCAAAGNPLPVIFSVDQNIWLDIEQHSPTTVYIFRTQRNVRGKTIGDGPGSMYAGDPIKTARDWMAEMMPVWANNKAHYYAPLNEQDPAQIEGFTWLNAFTLECLNIAEANGYQLALYAFSGGNPKDVLTPAAGRPFTRDDAWRELIPSLQRAKANGHILLLHEYGFSFGELRYSQPWLALRYRHAYRHLAQHNADARLVISEASANAGFGMMDTAQWLNDVKWYDSEIMKDGVVIGCCLYQLGGDENFVKMVPQLADYISQTPTRPETEQADPVVAGPDLDADGQPASDEFIFLTSTGVAPTPTPGPVPTPEPGPTPPTPTPTPEPGPIPTPTPDPVPSPPEPAPTPTLTHPISAGPLDFNVTVARVRKDPDRPGQIIVTFQIDATGGSGEYQYACEGVALSGATRDRPSTKSGAIVETYKVTSIDGQTVVKKFFFAARDFPNAT
ncbi:hypothetical protein TFLX_00018 [Thermoflexales bacterium]|nr:hypothetical protein TFLX_00018 [Thermoflexales bacterium]